MSESTGSNRRTSSGSSRSSRFPTYGGCRVTTSTAPASRRGSAANRSPWWNRAGIPSRRALARATATACGEKSVPWTSAPLTAFATARATGPDPVATSTATGRVLRLIRRMAWTARNSLDSRGTNTPGRAASFIPRNSMYPTICGIGSPRKCRSTSPQNRRACTEETSSLGFHRSPMTCVSRSSASMRSRPACQWSSARDLRSRSSARSTSSCTSTAEDGTRDA